MLHFEAVRRRAATVLSPTLPDRVLAADCALKKMAAIRSRRFVTEAERGGARGSETPKRGFEKSRAVLAAHRFVRSRP
jgi:hypothetical protein